MKSQPKWRFELYDTSGEMFFSASLRSATRDSNSVGRRRGGGGLLWKKSVSNKKMSQIDAIDVFLK